MVLSALHGGGGAMQTLNADCENRLRALAREFRVAASSVGWHAERFKIYAEMLDKIAAEILIEEDRFGTGQ